MTEEEEGGAENSRNGIVTMNEYMLLVIYAWGDLWRQAIKSGNKRRRGMDDSIDQFDESSHEMAHPHAICRVFTWDNGES